MSNNDVTVRNIFIAIMLVTIIAGYDIAHSETPLAQAQEVQAVVSTPTPAPQATTKPQDTPESYIREVFGEHSDKAFLLLKGKGPGTCAENRTLDPKAYNRNWIKNKPGEYWSTDWSIFQINDKFHPVEELNLKDDWKANIRYAYRMFSNDNFTFSRWACGKIYGI